MQPSGTSTVAPLGSRSHRVVLVAVVGLLLVTFLPTLIELVTYWIDHPEYGHGFLMPLVAGWLLWERKADLVTLRPQPSFGGVLLLIPCLAVLLLGEMKLSWFLKPYAFVGSLAAVLWAFYGWRAVRLCTPALIALLLMCPLPGRIQRAVTLPLKQSAALLATGMLDVSGVPSVLEGNVIHLPGIEDLWIADACSGIRSLISLVSLAIIACFFWPRHWILRVVVVLSAIPIAVFVNGLRIWITGLLAYKVDPDVAQGFFHFFEGFALFAIGALLLWAWALLLGRLFAREEA
jgi:exosortase